MWYLAHTDDPPVADDNQNAPAPGMFHNITCNSKHWILLAVVWLVHTQTDTHTHTRMVCILNFALTPKCDLGVGSPQPVHGHSPEQRLSCMCILALWYYSVHTSFLCLHIHAHYLASSADSHFQADDQPSKSNVDMVDVGGPSHDSMSHVIHWFTLTTHNFIISNAPQQKRILSWHCCVHASFLHLHSRVT